MQETVFSPLKYLDCLCRIFPVKGAIIVGAGMGHGQWFDLFFQQAVDDVLLIEADKDNVKYLEKKYSSRNQWKVLHQVVSDQEEECLFYRLSNSAESSLVHPDLLKALWPNISTKEELSCSTVTLDGLVQEKGYKANWLVIDTLPAEKILDGAQAMLANLDLVIVRVIKADETVSSFSGSCIGIDAFLKNYGLLRFGVESERHPALGLALYVRDVQLQTLELKQSYYQFEQQQKTWLEREVAWSQEKCELLVFQEATEQQRVAQSKRTEELMQSLQATKRELVEGKEALSKLADQQARQNRQDFATMEQKLLEQVAVAKQKKVVADEIIIQKNNENQHLHKKIKSLTDKLAELQGKSDPNKSGSHASLDEMLNDLSPFFSGRMITYVDVGAYTGDVFRKIYESKVIEVREVHLYEPNPDSYERLVENVGGYDLRSLHTYNFALGARSGEKQFSAAGTMTTMLNLSIDKNNASNIFSADTYSLDELGRTYTDGHIDLLKIDVEGMEMDVLEGARNLLREQQIDVIYIEVGFNKKGTQQTYFANIDTILQEFGYRIFRIYEQKNEWIRDSPLLRRCNFAYMSLRFSEANPLKKTQELVKLQKEAAELKQKLSACQARFEAGDK
jgi:FkbM family methyltransferase